MRSLLGAETDVEVVGEARDGVEAVEAILGQSPDLVFLDVQMPKLDGFEVIQTVGAERMPAVVFVTAYDQHALRAFEVQALDYLLKPFDQRALSGRAQARPPPDRQPGNRRPRPPPARARPRPQDRSASAHRPPGRQVRRPALLPARRTRSTGSKRPATTSGCTSAPTAHLLRETMNSIEGAAEPRHLLPHPSLAHRQHRADQGTAALVQRRVRRHPAQRRAADAEPRLPREAAGAARKAALAGPTGPTGTAGVRQVRGPTGTTGTAGRQVRRVRRVRQVRGPTGTDRYWRVRSNLSHLSNRRTTYLTYLTYLSDPSNPVSIVDCA